MLPVFRLPLSAWYVLGVDVNATWEGLLLTYVVDIVIRVIYNHLNLPRESTAKQIVT
jgi:hypothetical protein